MDSASLRAGPAATSTENCSHYRIRSENEQGGRYACRDRQIPALEQCRLELERDAEAADHDVGDAQVGDEIVGDGLNNHVRLCKVPGPGHDSEQEYEETVRSLSYKQEVNVYYQTTVSVSALTTALPLVCLFTNKISYTKTRFNQ